MATTMTLYHGTSTTHLPDIQLQGLIPKKGIGADAWAKKVRIGLPRHTASIRERSVYLTTDRATAEYFAAVTAQETNGEPAIVAVEVDPNRLQRDDDYTKWDDPTFTAFRVEGAIPATAIRYATTALSAGIKEKQAGLRETTELLETLGQLRDLFRRAA